MKTSIMEFLASDVKKICGVKRNRLQTWMEQGWIIPYVKKAEGHGTRNIFDQIDLIKIALFKKTVEGGIARSAVAEFIPRFERFVRQKGMFENMMQLIEQGPNWLWVFFYRKDGKVIWEDMGPHAVAKIPEDKDDEVILTSLPFSKKRGKLGPSDADDMISINLGKIIQDIYSKIEKIRG